MKSKFPHKFQFTRSATSWDIITTGPSAFKKGYRIIYVAKVERSSTIRIDIEDTCQYICCYYQRQRLTDTAPTTMMTISTSLGAAEPIEMSIPMDIGATVPVRNASDIEREEDHPQKRGRPLISQEEIGKRLDRVRRYMSYSKVAKNKSVISDCEETAATSIGSSVVQLIKKANVYTEQINGEESVSIVLGYLYRILYLIAVALSRNYH